VHNAIATQPFVSLKNAHRKPLTLSIALSTRLNLSTLSSPFPTSPTPPSLLSGINYVCALTHAARVSHRHVARRQ
jgi:hypothetical protein